MRSDPPEVGSALDWLRHARSDLALARMRKTSTVLYEHLCFHAQQSAGKALKAVLIQRGVRIPKSHDLAYLIGLLPASVRLPLSVVDLPVPTKYAVQQRYPGETPSLTAKDRRRAAELAQDVVAWATRVLR